VARAQADMIEVLTDHHRELEQLFPK